MTGTAYHITVPAAPTEGQFTYLEFGVYDITYGGFGPHRDPAAGATASTAGLAVTVGNGAVEASGDLVQL
ncbi:hypothetical protein [Virgisporangium ochraceum]|uniref:Uncharacterized protein n=1 Tax=Virgisporangium ochraceum TaxID=65505 RepID=A0A8J4EHW4_9ACTN|nr:hypothetical protein [Virgisporangium ochraceum]GIJ75131.1 hypothetical protein Voc01_100480 [Virgisporangium ochraceum]